VLPKTGRNITAAYLEGDPLRKPLTVEFNKDATKVTLSLPAGAKGNAILELAEGTEQFRDGRIVLSALDAKVEGSKAKLETHPGNHRIGFWSAVEDSVNWEYKATRPGMYDVELTYSSASPAGADVAVTVGSELLEATLGTTGSWYRYTTVSAGRVYIAKPGKVSIKVKGTKMTGGALMNFKALTLRPAPEGKPIVQSADGSIELDAHDATVHGTLLQYERRETKLCLGYWAKAEDWASWNFPITKPGKFKVLLTQGCGKGHGGSEVSVSVGGSNFDFTVEDTGGFQNWKERELGTISIDKAGDNRLEVRPKTKKGGAVMDIRRIRLVLAE